MVTSGLFERDGKWRVLGESNTVCPNSSRKRDSEW